MVSKALFTLQVLLIILPLVSVVKGPLHSTAISKEKNGQGKRDGRVIPMSFPRMCWGSPPACLDIKTIVTITHKITKRKKNDPKKLLKRTRGARRRPKGACYKNIRIKMTYECSRHQPIDFSDLTVYDFCINQYAQLAGSITMFYPITNPFSVHVNFSKVEEDDCAKREQRKRRLPAKKFHVANSHYLTADGCNLFGKFLCSRKRSSWCGCPIPGGKAPLFRARSLASADFIPKRLGYGKFKGRAGFHFPKGKACAEFTFDRVKPDRSYWHIMEN